MRPLHFISGLPRSGSTLLVALLRQNPAVHTHISSPLGPLIGAMLKSMSPANETALFYSNTQRHALLRGAFDNYYADLPAEMAVFDNSRSWTGRMDLLARLFPDARMIACVRPIPWILDSIERLVRRNAFELSGIFGHDPGGTAYSRADALMGENGLVGFPLAALKQAMHGDYSRQLLLVPYDMLAEHPQATLDAIYAFCGLPPFAHDVENIHFDTAEFDARLGTPGLHDIRPRAERVERVSILPPDLWARYESASIWRDPTFEHRGGLATGIVGSRPASRS